MALGLQLGCACEPQYELELVCSVIYERECPPLQPHDLPCGAQRHAAIAPPIAGKPVPARHIIRIDADVDADQRSHGVRFRSHLDRPVYRGERGCMLQYGREYASGMFTIGPDRDGLSGGKESEALAFADCSSRALYDLIERNWLQLQRQGRVFRLLGEHEAIEYRQRAPQTALDLFGEQPAGLGVEVAQPREIGRRSERTQSIPQLVRELAYQGRVVFGFVGS